MKSRISAIFFQGHGGLSPEEVRRLSEDLPVSVASVFGDSRGRREFPDFYEPVESLEAGRWYIESLVRDPRDHWTLGGALPQHYGAYVVIPYPEEPTSSARCRDGTLDALGCGANEMCVCCLWTGYGRDYLPTAFPKGPISGDEYWLYRARFGDLYAYLRPSKEMDDEDLNYQPVVMWPENRCWCMYMSFAVPVSCIGGPSAVAERLLAVPGAVAKKPSDRCH